MYDITGVVDVVSFGEVVYPYTDSIKHQIRNITFINSSQFYLITNTVMFEGGVGQAIKSLGDYGLFLFDNYSTGVVANETDVHIIIPVNLRKRWQIDR